MINKNYILFGIIAIVLSLIHFLLEYRDISWINHEFHAAIEAIGGAFSLVLALLLFSKNNDSKNYPILYLFGISFLLTGLFDIAHSFVSEGDSFVFFHSMGSFIGSVVLLLIFLPSFNKKLTESNYFLNVILTLSIITISVLFLWPELTPKMIVHGSFSLLSQIMNLLFGIFYFIVLIKLTYLQKQIKSYNYDYLILILLFMSLSGLTFSYSQVWNVEWWVWHILRFIAFIIGVFIIMNHQKELISRLNKLNKEANLSKIRLEQNIKIIKKKNEELEQFTYITSHDLQEPLNSIISFSDLLEDEKDKMEVIGQKSIEVIRSSAFRMKDFIISLLEYSKIGQEKEKVEINIAQLIEHLKIDLHHLIGKEQASVNYLGNPLKIVAFEPDLIKLFQSLVINGIKYTEKQTAPIIEINSEEQADKYMFSVKDNGIGIHREQYDKVFEVFQRLHSRDKYSGTGIGLSHCKKVVELHGGDIWLNSEEGKGTTFYFTIAK